MTLHGTERPTPLTCQAQQGGQESESVTRQVNFSYRYTYRTLKKMTLAFTHRFHQLSHRWKTRALHSF